MFKWGGQERPARTLNRYLEGILQHQRATCLSKHKRAMGEVLHTSFNPKIL